MDKWLSGSLLGSYGTIGMFERGGKVPEAVVAFELFGLSLGGRRRQVQMSR